MTTLNRFGLNRPGLDRPTTDRSGPARSEAFGTTSDPVGADDSAPDGTGPEVGRSTEGVLRRLATMLSTGRTVPMSPSVLVNRDAALVLVDEAVALLPGELREARWLLKEREEYLAKVTREGDEILEAARLQAERMVMRSEVVRQADQHARRTVETAREEARRMRLEAEDYCDQQLADLEQLLQGVIGSVAAGRRKLQAVPVVQPQPVEADESSEALDQAFFDQDRQ